MVAALSMTLANTTIFSYRRKRQNVYLFTQENKKKAANAFVVEKTINFSNYC